MINKLFLIIVLSGFVNLGFGQLIPLSGKVISTSKMAVPLASFKNLSEKNKITHADSSGNFSFKLGANSVLVVSSIGYKDTTLTITPENANNLVVTLTPVARELNAVSVESKKKTTQLNQSLSRAIAEGNLYYTQENGGIIGPRRDISGIDYNSIGSSGPTKYIHMMDPRFTSLFVPNASLNEIHHKEDTQGDKFYFNNWVKGIVVDTGYSITDDKSNFYNYNKITGDLIMTRDFASGLTIDAASIRFFILADSLKQNYTFVKVPSVSAKLFCNAVAMSDSYDIFKLTTTKFEKANYVSDGLTSHGNNYDEYIDKTTYYLLDVDNSASKPFALKRKALLEVFSNNPKAVSYISSHKEDINDEYLASLIASIR